jgi:hypothetical protein
VSEFLAEANVLIRPDTTKFRATLLAELEAATKGVVVPVTVVATEGSVRAARTTAAATQTVTAAKQKQAVADQVATRAAVDLANAQGLAATASAKLAAIEEADALAVNELAAAKAKLRASEAAVVAARRASTAATALENAELKANAAATLAAAEGELATARAAAEAAVAHARNAKEIAGEAAAHHALLSGARAAGASLTGLRGATLATSGAFLAGAVSVKLLEESIHEASREEEAAARSNKVFGESAEELDRTAEHLAGTLGLSAAAALDAESKFGNLFANAGIAQNEAAAFSEELVTLAANLAAFQNVPVADTLRAIQLGLVGNSRGLRQYQIELNQARVSAVALRLSGKENVKALTQEDKIRARINLLTQQTANVQGAAADRAGKLAQEEKIASAELANLGGVVGRIAIPKVTELLKEANLLIGALNKVGGAAESVADKVGGPKFGGAVGQLQELLNPTGSPVKKFELLKHDAEAIHDAFKDPNRDLKDLDFQGEKFSGTLQQLHQKAEQLFLTKSLDAFNAGLLEADDLVSKLAAKAANVSFDRAIKDVARLDEKLTDIRIAGGPGEQGAELGVLEAQAAAQQRAIDAAAAAAIATRGRSGHQTAVERRRQAKEDLLNTLTEIRQIQEDQAKAATDAAQKIADDAKAAAELVQKLLDEADQAFLDALGLKQGAFDIRQARIEATKSLVDDVQFQKDLQKFLLAEIAEARKTISNALLRAQTIQQLTAALVNSRIAEKQLHAEQVQNRQERRQAAFDRAATSIDLDIELAQTNKNVRAEIAARERRIKLDQERERAVKGDTIAAKRLRNDIAEQRAAIKELKGEVDKRRKDLEALEFAFLQTQSGFAANLLSNLLPTGAVAGTVGGGSISTPTSQPEAIPAADFARAAHQRPVGSDVTRASQTGTGPKGATSGQMAVLIAINRGILTALGRIAGQGTHPETRNQRIREAASMDIF